MKEKHAEAGGIPRENRLARYVVLAGDDYYPTGFADLVGVYENLPEAKKAGVDAAAGRDWFDILDVWTGETI